MTALRVGPRSYALLTRVVIASAAALWVLAPLHARTQGPYDSFRQNVADAPEEPDAWADDDIPAHISVVDGNATLERDGRSEPALENTPLLAGDRLRTDRGRVSILYADGSSLDIDQYASLDLVSDSLLRLNGGRIRLAVVRVTLAQPLRVDGAGATAWISQPGEYRVSLGDPRATSPEMTLATLRGSAELVSSVGRTQLRSGTAAATTANTAPTAPWTINVSATDEFDRWSEDLRNARFGTQSTEHLPSEMNFYSGTLDTSGSWASEATYGDVWYPSVGVGWWPYCDGRWSFIGSYGWTWTGGPRWVWPTHHYGRWGNTGGKWFWVPDRRWSPGWVAWTQAPGYVGWSPLGFDNRPVHGFASSQGNPNSGWTILPSHALASRTNVRDFALSVDRLSASTWAQFARRGAPTRPSMISVNEVPLRAPGAPTRGRALPRGTVATPIPIGAARQSFVSAPRPGATSRNAGTAGRTSAGPANAIAPQASGRTAAPRTNGAAPSGYPDSGRSGTASPYAGIPAPPSVAGNGRTAPSGYGATAPTAATSRGGLYPAARPVYPSPADAGNRGAAEPRAPLPIIMRGTPPTRPVEPPAEVDSGGFGAARVGSDRPAAGSGAPSTGYSPSSARPRGGDSPSAAPQPRGGAPASAGPSPRGGPPTAGAVRGGAAPGGWMAGRGRGGQ